MNQDSLKFSGNFLERNPRAAHATTMMMLRESGIRNPGSDWSQ